MKRPVKILLGMLAALFVVLTGLVVFAEAALGRGDGLICPFEIAGRTVMITPWRNAGAPFAERTITPVLFGGGECKNVVQERRGWLAWMFVE